MAVGRRSMSSQAGAEQLGGACADSRQTVGSIVTAAAAACPPTAFGRSSVVLDAACQHMASCCSAMSPWRLKCNGNAALLQLLVLRRNVEQHGSCVASSSAAMLHSSSSSSSSSSCASQS